MGPALRYKLSCSIFDHKISLFSQVAFIREICLSLSRCEPTEAHHEAWAERSIHSCGQVVPSRGATETLEFHPQVHSYAVSIPYDAVAAALRVDPLPDFELPFTVYHAGDEEFFPASGQV